ncbi:malonic semialdehyde reductase [Leeia sp. TBRC 13508]|uniref:Putative NADH dehydrogenase/NAD(P)H nitroreductase LIN78_04890 n=1 Tax=Leeia speluncae TaxID=2884804 RepID=A0ABS8D3Y8_9NEIS|nr:malonic semialdehyde reductase [Leeia speluncae]MCB6182886.1 malonic semialdehyde reductase [Leeia speluncae]
MSAVSTEVLKQAFTEARTFNKFTDQPVSEATLRELYDLFKWAPTSMNSQPARLVFLTSAEAKQKLAPALSPGNLDKTLAAPVTVIIAQDNRFFDHLPTQFPAYDAKPMFEANAALADATAFRNSSLQGAYLIIAARLLGLDSGAMSGFDPAKVNEAFFADGKYKVNFLLNLGYGDASGNYPRGPRLSFEEVAEIL